MKLKPLGKKVLLKVLLKPFVAETMPAGGLRIVTRVENQVVRRGEVVARGAEVPADVAEGDTVQFIAAFDVAKVTLDGVEHLLMEYDSIIGVEAPEKVMATVGATS